MAVAIAGEAKDLSFMNKPHCPKPDIRAMEMR
jgi:hypothetical protein